MPTYTPLVTTQKIGKSSLTLRARTPKGGRKARPAQANAEPMEECQMRNAMIVAALAVLLGNGAVQAASKCDAGVSKAIGKYVACRCSAYSKSQKKDVPPDFGKCNDKFNGATGACQKAQAKGDCVLFGGVGTCASKAADVVTDAADLCNSSPSGAFLE